MKDIDYDNVDTCLNVLYDFYYNRKHSSDCYRFQRIIVTDLSIHDIRKDDSFDETNVLKNSVEFIEKNHDKYTFKRLSDSTYPLMLKIDKYNLDNTNLNDMRRGENVDLIMHKLFSELVVNEQTKFILLPLMNFNTTMQRISKANKNLHNALDYKPNDILYVQCFEYYKPMKTAKQYLKELKENFKLDVDDVKKFIYQVIHVLDKITEVYPRFRHNSLDLDSIYIVKGDNSIKLTNFSNSVIPGLVDNIDTNKKSNNLYYDVHYFLHHLYYLLKSYDALHFELTKFFNTVLPEKFRSADDDFTGLDEAFYEKEVVTVYSPKEVLKNNFFSEFIKNSMDSNSSNVKSYAIKENSIDYSISSSITHDIDSPLLIARKQVKRKSKDKSVTNREGSMAEEKTYKKNQNIAKGRRALHVPEKTKKDNKQDVFRYSETGLTVTEAGMDDSDYESYSDNNGQSENLVLTVSDSESEVYKPKQMKEGAMKKSTGKNSTSKKSTSKKVGSETSQSIGELLMTDDSDSYEEQELKPRNQPNVKINKFRSLFNETGNTQMGNPMGMNQMGNPMGMNQMGNPMGMNQMGNPMGGPLTPMSPMTPMGPFSPNSPMTPPGFDYSQLQMGDMGPLGQMKNNYFTGSVEDKILDRLPSNYEGVLPDLYQHNLPMPGSNISNPMMGNNFSLPQFGTSLPQPGLDPMQMRALSDNGITPQNNAPLPTATMPYYMGQGIPFSTEGPPSNAQLPDHLVMSPNNQQQGAGKSNNFFF